MHQNVTLGHLKQWVQQKGLGQKKEFKNKTFGTCLEVQGRQPGLQVKLRCCWACSQPSSAVIQSENMVNGQMDIPC